MKKKTWIALLILIVLVIAVALVWHFCNPANEADSADKTIEVKVIHGDGSEKDFTIQTNAEFLRGALEEKKLVEGDEGEFGLYITSVDGETANADNQEWWCVNDGEGEMLSTGIESAPIQDGDRYEIVFTAGW